MSNTVLVYDSGTIHLVGAAQHQIGPTLDIRKYSKIRVIAKDFGGIGALQIHLRVKEGNVTIQLPPSPLLFIPAGPAQAPGVSEVFDVLGRELEVFVDDLGTPTQVRIFIFGLED